MKKIIEFVPNIIKIFAINKYFNYTYIFIFGWLGYIKFKVIKNLNIDSQYKRLKIFGPKNLFYTYYNLIYKYYFWVFNLNQEIINISGVGYKCKLYNKFILFLLGYSHLVYLTIPYNIYMKIYNLKSLSLFSIDLNILNQFIYKLKKKKKINVYKGKGLLLKNEKITLKEGKKANF